MVEQTRQPGRAVSLQAGPGGLNSGTQFDTNLSLRINDGAAQIFGRQLAVIGDQLDKEWAGRRPNWLPTGLHVLGPAYALTRTIYWHLQTHVWGYQGLAAAVKAWMLGTSLGKGMLRTHTWGAWVIYSIISQVSNVKPISCPGWTRGALATVALAVAATILMHYGWTMTSSEQ